MPPILRAMHGSSATRPVKRRQRRVHHKLVGKDVQTMLEKNKKKDDQAKHVKENQVKAFIAIQAAVTDANHLSLPM